MTSNGVCAIVVTFRPDEKVLYNLAQLRPQVQAIVVIDNGSSREAIATLKQIRAELDLNLIENGENFGLSRALNIGINWALAHDFTWVMFFDQDSTVTPGFAESMLRTYQTHTERDRIAIVAPRYIDRRSGNRLIYSPQKDAEGILVSAWTSGSLVPTKLARKYGGFEEQLIIDLLDYEYSLRFRDNGYLIVECSEARLLHAAGNPRTYHFLGRRLFTTHNQSPARAYYVARNRIWILRKYGGRFRGLWKEALLAQIKTCCFVLIGEQSRAKKTILTLRGLRDGLIGRMGKTVEL